MQPQIARNVIGELAQRYTESVDVTVFLDEKRLIEDFTAWLQIFYGDVEKPPEIGQPFSERELQILRGIAQGKTNHQIAHELVIGEGTVRNYVSQILVNGRWSNRAQAAANAKFFVD